MEEKLREIIRQHLGKIVEFNPLLDKEHRTEKCIPQLISAVCMGEFDDA